jgi:hypothetical protein
MAITGKHYLGDSVYVEFDGYHIILTTDNGLGPSNTIYVEPPVLAAFEQYVAELKRGIASLTTQALCEPAKDAKKSNTSNPGFSTT